MNVLCHTALGRGRGRGKISGGKAVMVRKHGWQLPAHTLQVVAITVFCLLVVAFYAFLAPVLGGRVCEYVVLSAYTPVAFLVFILYARCTAINPADPGILSLFRGGHKLDTEAGGSAKEFPRKFGEFGTEVQSSPSSASRSSVMANNANRIGAQESSSEINHSPQGRRLCCNILCGMLCIVFVREDRCRKNSVEEQNNAEEALFCTLCNAEVYYPSILPPQSMYDGFTMLIPHWQTQLGTRLAR
ncbi:putative protein S-acyltransferase 20 [Drosera capensis]